MNNGLKLILGVYITITTTITASTLMDVKTVTKLDNDIHISTNVNDSFIIDNCGDLIGSLLIDTCTVNYNGDITTSLTQLDENSPISISSTLNMESMTIEGLDGTLTQNVTEITLSETASEEML